MKKFFKSFMVAGAVLSSASVAISATSCGHKKSGGGFSGFQNAADADGKNILSNHASFKVTNYWGAVGINASEDTSIANKIAAAVSNIDPDTGKLKAAVNGAFEEAFDNDAKNTIVTVFLSAQAGDSMNSVFSNAKVIFNSWDNKDYSTSNWGNIDTSPDYSVNKFFNSLKTNQSQLVKIFGANTDPSKMLYQGADKFSINKLDGAGKLSSQSGKSGTSFPVVTNYNLTITAEDSNMNIVNIITHFSFKSGGPVLDAKTITSSTFNNNIISSSLKSSNVTDEINAFISTYKADWMSAFVYGVSGQTKTLKLTNISNIATSDTGVVSMTLTGSPSNSKNGFVDTTYNVVSDPVIKNGFSSSADMTTQNYKYARFTDANYKFSTFAANHGVGTNMWDIFNWNLKS